MAGATAHYAVLCEGCGKKLVHRDGRWYHRGGGESDHTARPVRMFKKKGGNR